MSKKILNCGTYQNTVRHDSEQETDSDEDVEDNIPERTSTSYNAVGYDDEVMMWQT